MKLHFLEITGMGPYAGQVKIDFDALDRAGVYLLSGPTGAGKTTVLDAISYALFGKIPRAATGSEVVSDHRELSTIPKVCLEVTVGGELLRITRIPEHVRLKEKGEGTTGGKQSLVVEAHHKDEWSTITTNWTEGNNELTGRVGMNASQFSQVVMLPQGDFARFLQSKSNDRKELLEQLFPGADLTWIENWFKDRAISDRQKREVMVQSIADCFQAAKTSTPPNEDGEVVLPEQAEADPALDWIHSIEEALSTIDTELAGKKDEAAELAQTAEADLKKLQAEAELVRRRIGAEEEQSKLDAKSGWRKQAGEEIAKADRAAAVLGLVRAAEQRRTASEAARERANELRESLAGNELTRDLDPDEYIKARAGFSTSVTTIANFERDDLPRRRDLTTRITNLERDLAKADDTGPSSPVGKADLAVGSAEKATLAAKARYVEIRETRTRGMAAELAGLLESGQPCAVCGSTEHPSPAHAEAVTFTADDEDQADEVLTRAMSGESSAREGLARVKSEAAEKKATAGTELAGARTSLVALIAREEELASGAASVTARREQLDAANELIDGLMSATKTADDLAATAKQASAEASEAATKAEFASTEEAMSAAREESSLIALKTKVGTFDKTQAIVAERLEVELAGIDPKRKVEIEPARQKAIDAGVKRDEAAGLAGIARNNLKNFRTETGPVAGLYAELAPLRQAAASSAELDRMAGGKNERSMRLSIYVLATRLRQVIKAANHHLETMSNQRYELLYTGDKKGNAMAGLGIEVFDSYTSGTRPVSTLSGGESFCASLSLALGLAEVVQAESGGKSVETLFIDEGFGTLDAKSLDKVMDVIDSLREKGRSVGLVSHVEELKQRIPARIEVEPGRNGSTLTVTTDGATHR